MGLATEIPKSILIMTDNKNARVALAAFVISTLVIAVAILIVSISYDDKGLHFAIPASLSIAYVVAYFILFIGSWFILYLLNVRDTIDVYKDVREKLCGDWTVTYAANKGPAAEHGIIAPRAIPARIDVSPEQKLIMVFKIVQNPIFADDVSQVIRDVAVRYNDEGGYTLMYYYKGERGLQQSIAQSILSETSSDRHSIEVEIFGRLTFNKPGKGEAVKDIQGHYFDLNGNLTRLYGLLDLRTAAAFKNEDFSPIRLSQVPIHQATFDADMGVVTFQRS
jgi:hypothetical protein